MVLAGKVNKNLVSLINAVGATTVGLSGLDSRLLTARPVPNSAQLDFVGEVARVAPNVLEPLIDYKYITVAGELAAALGAEKLILLTDMAGILENRENLSSLVKEIVIK